MLFLQILLYIFIYLLSTGLIISVEEFKILIYLLAIFFCLFINYDYIEELIQKDRKLYRSFCLFFNDFIISICFMYIFDSVLSMVGTGSNNYYYISQIRSTYSQIVMLIFLFTSVGTYFTKVKRINILIILFLYSFFGFIFNLKFDMLTSIVVILYIVFKKYFKSVDGKKIVKEYDLGINKKFDFIDLDYISAVLFISKLINDSFNVSDKITPHSLVPNSDSFAIIDSISIFFWNGACIILIFLILTEIIASTKLTIIINKFINKFVDSLLDDITNL